TSNAGVDPATDDGSGRTAPGTPTDPNPECFKVGPVTPTLSTTAVDSAGVALTGPVDFGQPIYDRATLSGTAKEPSSTGSNNTYPSILTSTPSDGSAAAGTIKFWLYGPFSTGTPTAAQ